MPKVSAVFITLNEEANIERALKSVDFADEIIVLDTGSEDATRSISRENGAVVERIEWPGYVEAKNHVASLAKHEWILSLDADEEVTPELRDEIKSIIAGNAAANGYRIARRNHYLGKWIKHCGWYPDYQIRLWRSSKGKWQGGSVHESVAIDGEVATANHAMNHYTYDSMSEHLVRMNQYAGLIAADKFKSGKRTNMLTVALAAPWMFFKMYLLRGGILDGKRGVLVSVMGAFYYFLKKSRLWELQLSDDRQ